MATSPDAIEVYIAARSEPVQVLLEELRTLVRAAQPGWSEGMKWGAPAFFKPDGTAVVYLYGGKDHAHLGFVPSAGLHDPDGLLKGRGGSRHAVLYPGKPRPVAALTALLKQF